ncbi:MAG: hypothetical protein PHS14_09490 [Elusimicrobia bacterium]|nr:hypothetical protein [Elusimicrobiota bacterium]
MKIVLVVAAGIAGALTSCATAPTAKTPEEVAYLASVAGEELEFDLVKAASDDAWGRAQVFLAKHSSMKVQTATTNLVENYTPTPDAMNPNYGYRVTRAAGPKGEHFSVECFTGNPYAGPGMSGIPARNAKILARYIKTAELPFPGLIAK